MPKKLRIRKDDVGELKFTSRSLQKCNKATNSIEKISIKMFDAVADCRPMSCENRTRCPYVTADHEDEDGNIVYVQTIFKRKCQIRVKYIGTILDSLIQAIPNNDEMTVHRISIMLVPLYSSLIDFKLAALATQGDVYYLKGINPIYKEMRATIKMINDLLAYIAVVPGSSPGTGKNQAGDLLNGDSDAYGEILNGSYRI